MHKVSLVWAVLGLLEDGLNDIVAVLVKHHVFEDLRVLHQMSEEESLWVYWSRAAYCTLHYIGRNFLSAVVSQVVTDELGYLDVDLFVVVF